MVICSECKEHCDVIEVDGNYLSYCCSVDVLGEVEDDDIVEEDDC